MDLKSLLQNKTILLIAGVSIVVILALVIMGAIMGSSKNSNPETKDVSKEYFKEDIKLLTTDNLGKALEIQALLAKHGIVVARGENGSK
ncbi:MAG: hypothetical protein NC334_02970, partial [Bacteroides sp.]|nr:hypothetical protein [Bacteroides sp.]